MVDYFININNGRGTQDCSTFANAGSSLANLPIAAPASSRILLQRTDPVNQANTIQCTQQSLTATLGSAQTVDIYLDGAWTANANVTTTASGTRKQGATSSSLSIAAGFTTGVAGYYATGLLNLATCQKISFWINTSAIVAANTLQIQLCSDTIGAVAVNSFTIPYATVANTWHLFTLDNLGALGSVINSVNLNCLLDPGTVVVLIDNIIGCTATGLNMSQILMFGDYAFGMKSLTGTTVVFDQGTASVAGSGRGFWHPNGSGTYPLVTQESYPMGTSQTLATTNGSMLISGGWDSTAMNVQSGLTWIDTMGLTHTPLSLGTKCASSENMGHIRAGSNAAFYSSSTVTQATNIYQTNGDWNGTAPLGGNVNLINAGIATNCRLGNGSCNVNITYTPTVAGVTFKNCILYSGAHGFIFNASAVNATGITLDGCLASNNLGNGFGLTNNANYYVYNCEAYNNGAPGFNLSNNAPSLFFNLTASGNTTANYSIAGGSTCTIYNAKGGVGAGTDITNAAGNTGTVVFVNPTLGSTTKVSALGIGRIITQRENGNPATNVQYTTFGNILTDSASSHSGQAWRFSPTSLTPKAAFPMNLCIGTFEMLAGKTLTVSAFAARTSANINGQLKIRGLTVQGIPSDVTIAMTPTAVATPAPGNYTQYTLPGVTPTENCVVEVWAEVYSSSGLANSFWVDTVAATST